MVVCKRVIYSGRVQGVGFRYAAQGIARGFAVRGYVRNLADGDVELVAQGEPGEVDRFLAEVARHMAGNIHSATATEESPGGFHGFQIRH
jgi:acylphosphatase